MFGKPLFENDKPNLKYYLLGVVFLVFVSLFFYLYKIDFFVYKTSFTESISALLVPIIALLSIYIAFQQWQISAAQKRISNNKLRLDLFEKRIAIYYAIRNLINKISAGNITIKIIITYMDGVRDARWFLTDQIHLYLNETIYNNACRLQEIDEELKGSLSSGERTRLVRDRRKIRDWFAEQGVALDKRFSLYLKFRLKK